MGLFSAVIDNSPVDRFGSGNNATSLSQYGDEAFMRSKELWDPYSNRNQMFKEQAMSDAYDMSSFQNMHSRRQAARTGQTSLGGFESSAQIRDQVRKQQMQLMMANQQQSGSFLGQAGQMQGQAGNMRNSLNSLYRQQQSANQQSRMQSKAAVQGLVGGAFAGLAGPALGALGGKIAGAIAPADGIGSAVSGFAGKSANFQTPSMPTGFMNNAWGNITNSVGLGNNMPSSSGGFNSIYSSNSYGNKLW